MERRNITSIHQANVCKLYMSCMCTNQLKNMNKNKSENLLHQNVVTKEFLIFVNAIL